MGSSSRSLVRLSTSSLLLVVLDLLGFTASMSVASTLGGKAKVSIPDQLDNVGKENLVLDGHGVELKKGEQTWFIMKVYRGFVRVKIGLFLSAQLSWFGLQALVSTSRYC